MKNSMIIIGLLLLVIVSGGSFYAGMTYQNGKTARLSRQFNGAPGQGQRLGVNGNRQGFRPVSGSIISKDDKSITVKLQDGSSRIVILSDKTTINKAAAATKDDLTVNETVSVFGTDNSDGSVTAQTIQLNPQQFRGSEATATTTPKP